MTALLGVDSETPPTVEQVRAAIAQRVTWWAWYVGGDGAAHVWTDEEVGPLTAGGLELSLPIWVPALDLSGDPHVDYQAARRRARALGWYGPVALDTEASMRGNHRLFGFVDGWNDAAAAQGDPQVVYGGGNYVGSAHAWWIISWPATPPTGQAHQTGGGNIDGVAVDWDQADAAFPLSALVPPAPPPLPPIVTVTGDPDVAKIVPLNITTDPNGNGDAIVNVPLAQVFAVEPNGSDPESNHAYSPIPRHSKSAFGAGTKIEIEGGPESATVLVWVTVAS